MDLTQLLMQQLSGDGVQEISRQIGADEGTTHQAIGTAIPVLISALAQNSSRQPGAVSLQHALEMDHDGSILDNLSGYLNSGTSSSMGPAILGHVLGNRQDNVTGAIAKRTGLDSGRIMRLLMTLAPLVMGALGKVRAQNRMDSGSLSGYLNEQRQQAQSTSPDLMGMLSDLLDSNQDGSVMDDLGNIAEKFSENRRSSFGAVSSYSEPRSLKVLSSHMMNETWKFSIEERVRWGDVDAARIIFYGAYIRFFEFAETELFRSVGLPYGLIFDQLDVWLPRVHIECDFHRAAQLDDLLQVSVFIGHIGTKSFRLNFEVRRKGEQELIADAHFILVAVRRDTFETVPVPDQLIAKLRPYTDPSAVR